MRHSVNLTEELHQKLRSHLIRYDGQEDLCFGLWYPSQGDIRLTGLINKIIYPGKGERSVHGNVSFHNDYFIRVIKQALNENAGIVFMHSHPSPGWQKMSYDDVEAEKMLAQRAYGATGLPLIGMTIGNDGTWSARFWYRYKKRFYHKHWAETVRIIGDRLDIHFNESLFKNENFGKVLDRTVSSWGPKRQKKLSRLKIGIIGAGSVGSIIAESLSRMGVSKISIIDFDKIKEENLDRSLHYYSDDVGKYKASVLIERIKRSATHPDFEALGIIGSICNQEIFQKTLDCDILFSCVDRPWPRQVLDLIAYAHLIPVIDGGIRVDPLLKNDEIVNVRTATWNAHVIGPTRPCMECIGQYDPGFVQLERDGYLDDPTYINQLPAEHFAKKNQNVFAFSQSLASLEIQHFISLIINPGGVSRLEPLTYRLSRAKLERNRDAPEKCKHGCWKNFLKIDGFGDNAEGDFIH